MDISRANEDFHELCKIRVPSFKIPGMLTLARSLILKDRPVPAKGVSFTEEDWGGKQVRICVPDKLKSDTALFLIHGGGLIMGTPVVNDQLASIVASKLGIRVFSPAYRLAPEHKAPAAIDDCLSSWTALQETAERYGVDPHRIVLGGNSAGGGLAACLAHRLVDAGSIQPLALALIYPMLDDRTALDKEKQDVDYFVWSNKSNLYGWRAYLGRDRMGTSDLPDDFAAARRKDLSGLPPTWIGVGDIDLFLEENERYADKLKAAGVEVDVKIMPGAPHAFETYASDSAISVEFIGSYLDFLERHIP
ncbi:MAG: alpha/beta hydrolase [Pseudomonadota bacterium]